MKVKKCAVVAVPADFTFAQMKESEGIYKHANSTTSRMIVFKNSHGSLVLYYSGATLEPAIEPTWTGYKFTKTDEEVCFELCPKK